MNKPRVLYLSYTGLMQPLGHSQILAYLKRLSDDYCFTLISFEKQIDLDNEEGVLAMKQVCESYNIEWLPQKYHQTPRLLSTLLDMLIMLKLILKTVNQNRVSLIHCRSYIPMMVGILFKSKSRPVIFDMRALWVQELVAAKRLVKPSLLYYLLVKVELFLLRSSSHVVSLTQAAVEYLITQDDELEAEDFSVITTCVDLEKFTMPDVIDKKNAKLGTMGTVDSGWYELDWFFKILQYEQERSPNSQFSIISRDNADKLYGIAKNYQITESYIDIKSSLIEEISLRLHDLKAAILLFSEGLAKLGSAPTRMGELLACGVPLIVNRIGDMAGLIEKYHVGVIIKDDSEQSIQEALSKLDVLLIDPDLPHRCRRAAEDYFSVNAGAKKYRKIYQGLLVN